ncbi:NLI interacting factor-like phosphatase [Nitzschia inconspicua]|uniref:NLI interacting factor-like phosphatase n=1 Tax=Nitzschia inconspicua TaxID=303405 RepID=A0A9K3Q1Q2_9STRA|nr:NLI interacting factor-like phosphatase [Nitzschia inconspicua]
MAVQKTIPIKNNNNNTNNTSAAGVRTIRLPLHEGTTDPSLFQHQQQWAQQHYVKLRPHVNDLLRGIESTYEVSAYTAGTKHYAEEVTMVLCRNLVGSHRDRDDVERLRYQVQLQLQMAQQQQQQHHHQQQQIIIIINDTFKNNNTNTMDNTDDIGNNNVAAKNKRTNDQMQQQQVQQKQDDKEKEEGNMDMNDE